MKTQNDLTLGMKFSAENQHRLAANSFIERQVQAFEINRFGLMAVFMVLQVCVASAAVYYIFQSGTTVWQLMICAALTMFSNTMLIAQAPARWCVVAFYLSLIFNTLLILINL